MTHVHALKKTRDRLAALDQQLSSSSSSTSLASFSSSSSSSSSLIEITQREYVTNLQRLQADVVAAWTLNQKVEALRIAIKSVKLLALTGSPSLYATRFAVVADVLDTFGGLVFDRIHHRAQDDWSDQGIKSDGRFRSDDVPLQAKETCRNWFYKTACIRELLPRMYVRVIVLGRQECWSGDL